jgi:hypothetical protein
MAKVKRPIVRVRNSQAHDDAKIVEATSPRGAGLLIDIHTKDAEDRGLYVRPYRAERDVYLMIAPHENDCEVFTSRAFDRCCDCGACMTYDAASSRWRPTQKRA